MALRHHARATLLMFALLRSPFDVALPLRILHAQMLLQHALCDAATRC